MDRRLMARELRRLFERRARREVHAAVAEFPREKHRKRAELQSALAREDKRGDRKLAAVELAGDDLAMAHADIVEPLGELGLELEVDIFDADRPVEQCLGIG